MSTLNVNTIADATGSNPVAQEYVSRGSAKAWANLNGTGTIALRDSLNVSGVVDNGTGDYTYSLTSNMGSGDYSAIFTGRLNTTTTNDPIHPYIHHSASALSTSSFRMRCRISSNGALSDAEELCSTLTGDLA